MNVQRELLDVDLDTLRRWVETRENEVMPEELVIYLEQLEKVYGWHHTMMLEHDIIKNLIATYPEMSRYKAKHIYADAINYFYLDNDVSQEAWANIYAERLDKLALLLLKTADTPDQLHKVKDIWKEAATLRGAYSDKKDEIPAEFYEKRVVLYTNKLEDIGMPPVSRSEIAKMIDGMPLTQAEALDLKRDAAIEPQILFNPNESSSED
ncbi:hypothetical protein ACE939_00875 [Aquimarina sp. W85]|uniref:hypothetical protein n=1 Tax=Aquimarina rhodophyticola TaxID=3342246 RepID=UPI00366AA385